MSLSADMAAIGAADAVFAQRGPLPLPLGALAPVVVGAVRGSAAGDWWIPGWHERAGAVLRGVDLGAYGDGTLGSRPYRVAPVIEGLGARALFAVGLAAAEGRRALVHLGVGAVGDGDAHEALNLASLLSAPVTFLVAAWDIQGLAARGAPIGPQLGPDLERWLALFMPVAVVDGSSVDAVREAVSAARSVPGPRAVIARVTVAAPAGA